MGKSKRLWRKLVKKLRRKKKRQIRAQSQLLLDQATYEETDAVCDKGNDGDVDEGVPEPDNEFFLHKEEWESRERQLELASTMKRIEMEKLALIEAEKQRKIREEWEAKQEHERKVKEEKERLEKQLKEKQEEEFNEFLTFLSGDIETPPTKYLLPDTDTISDGENVCYYFSKTAACRFYDRCTKLHPRPTLSTAILIPNFFSHFKLEQSIRDEYDSDLGLEYEDKELHKEFMEFYDDVVPELRKFGTLIQFKVCCNLEPHLRGNVYVQYQNIKESVEAYRKFNGRFYNGKQLSLQFIKMDSWRSAICGSFLRKLCLKGRSCNYLHVFRNPTKEFVKADHDWKDTQHRHRISVSAQVPPPAPQEQILSCQNTPQRRLILPTTPTLKEKSECHVQNQRIAGGQEDQISQSSHTLPDKSSKLQKTNRKRERSRSPSVSVHKKRKKDKKKKSKKEKKHKKHKHRTKSRSTLERGK